MAESPMKDHPLGLAARYNDAECEEKGFTAVFPSLGLALPDVMYISEQRAMRVMLGHIPHEINMTPVRFGREQLEQLATLQSCVLDGIVIGWRAHIITLRDADNG